MEQRPAPAPQAAALDFQALEQPAREGRWGVVRQALAAMSSTLSAPGANAQAQRQWRGWQLRAAAFWWQPLQGGGVLLRRTQADDADFYKACFADAEFARRYNRQASWRGDLARALQQAGTGSPVDLKALHWIVCDRSGRRLGLASLSSLNLANSRAEVSLGLHGPGLPPMAGAMAMLWIYHLAFFQARLNKLYSYVYTANPEALANSVRVGLHHEGTLKDHFYLPPGEFVDVHVMGLTRSQLLADTRLLPMAKRRLKLDWR